MHPYHQLEQVRDILAALLESTGAELAWWCSASRSARKHVVTSVYVYFKDQPELDVIDAAAGAEVRDSGMLGQPVWERFNKFTPRSGHTDDGVLWSPSQVFVPSESASMLVFDGQRFCAELGLAFSRAGDVTSALSERWVSGPAKLCEEVREVCRRSIATARVQDVLFFTVARGEVLWMSDGAHMWLEDEANQSALRRMFDDGLTSSVSGVDLIELVTLRDQDRSHTTLARVEQLSAIECDPLATLVPIERSIIERIVSGQSRRELGRALALSRHHLNKHLANIHRVFGTSNQIELIRALSSATPFDGTSRAEHEVER